MATWPVSLPYFLLGAKETPQEGALRTPMDMGPPKSRQRFTAVSRYLDCEIILQTPTERATFDTFYYTTLANGSLEFDHEDPADATTQQFKFMQPPQFEYPQAGAGSGVKNTRVKMRLEILP